jgi:hypothetical protein
MKTRINKSFKFRLGMLPNMINDERENLRNELHFLKNCQLQYFILSVAAAGAIAGFGKGISNNSTIYLAPLLVILPCWWIFFDKGTTISRIVAYLRLIEGMILKNRATPYVYIGWENSLFLFRKNQQKLKFLKRLSHYLVGIWMGLIWSTTLLTTHKYWAINWYTFFGLGFTSLWLSSPSKDTLLGIPWIIFLILFIISTIHNLSVLGRLTNGYYSYDENLERWKEVLKTPEAQNFLTKMF